MGRFEIEDIIDQDAEGVVFRATDNESGDTVAIHRFFPFGQNNGGLDQEESIAFSIASKKLSEIEHASLRAVIEGGTDPIDRIPYLATEWVDGASLRIILASEAIEPSVVIDILRLALEVSTVISYVLGEEGVWVETSVESIVVGTESSGRGFTFVISPFKWLGTDAQSKNLLSIVELGEELTGWKGKPISAQAGYGLGSWLKCIKRNSDISLHEALELLANLTGNEPPQPEQEIIQQAVRPASRTNRSLVKTGFVVATAVIALSATTLIYFHKTTEAPAAEIAYFEQKISPLTTEEPHSSEARPDTSRLSATDRINALAVAMSDEAVGKTSKIEAEKSELEKIRTARGGVYTPDDTLILKSLKQGTPLKFRGTLKEATPSTTGDSIYLLFSAPYKIGQVRGVLHESDFKDKFATETFKQFIGKTIVLEGKAFNEMANNPVLVKITTLKQITSEK